MTVCEWLHDFLTDSCLSFKVWLLNFVCFYLWECNTALQSQEDTFCRSSAARNCMRAAQNDCITPEQRRKVCGELYDGENNDDISLGKDDRELEKGLGSESGRWKDKINQ